MGGQLTFSYLIQCSIIRKDWMNSGVAIADCHQSPDGRRRRFVGEADRCGRMARGGDDQPLTNAVFLRAQCDADNCRQVSGVRKITDLEPDGNSSLVAPLFVADCSSFAALI